MTTAPPSLLTPRVLIPFVIVTLIWGSTWIVIRDQLGNVPPSWSVTWRFLLAGAAMLPLAALRGEKLWLGRRGMALAGAVGVLQFALNFNFVYRSELYLTSGVVAVIFALLIVPNSILSRLFLGTRLERRFLAGSSIAIIGIILLLVQEARALTGGTAAAITGGALALVAVCCASIANVLQASPPAKSLPPFALIGWSMLAGTLANALWAWASAGPPVIDTAPTYLLGVAYLAFVGSVISFPLYFGIIRDVGAGPAAWTGVLIPVVAMAISTLVEGYAWSGLSVAGAILALAGLIVALRPAAKPETGGDT